MSENTNKSEKINKNEAEFKKLGISPTILAVLEKLNLSIPTPIQNKAIPTALAGQDLIGVAQTGTGKTFAFGIPMIQRLALYKGRGLVLLPTRELASQVEESLRKLGGSLGLKTIALVGGENIGGQIMRLRSRPHVLVATPGRLNDHLKRRTVKLDDIKVLVLDEADMMFDMGFAPQIEEIMKQMPLKRQTLLFSATMPAAIIKLAEKYLAEPIHIEVAPSGTTAELVDQEMYIIPREDRFEELQKVLGRFKGSVLIFVRTKHGVSNLTEKLQRAGQSATEIHSNLSFNQRRQSLAGFKAGAHRILVATDVAARGLDVTDLELVINFDLPENSEDYVHRIGRTARAGKQGKAISFALPNQRREIQKIERLIRKNLVAKELGRSGHSPQRAASTSPAGRSFRSESRSASRPFRSASSASRPFRSESKPVSRPFRSNDSAGRPFRSGQKSTGHNFSSRQESSDRPFRSAAPAFNKFKTKHIQTHPDFSNFKSESGDKLDRYLDGGLDQKPNYRAGGVSGRSTSNSHRSTTRPAGGFGRKTNGRLASSSGRKSSFGGGRHGGHNKGKSYGFRKKG